jgi:hypothetical protein
VTTYYIDTSAAIKLLVCESHSVAFAEFYDERHDDTWVSSSLLRVELMRAVTRTLPAAVSDARALLLAFDYVGMDDEVVDAAMNEQDPMLRALDAIHLATARLLGSDVAGFVTYDDRLRTASTRAGLTVVSPRTGER